MKEIYHQLTLDQYIAQEDIKTSEKVTPRMHKKIDRHQGFINKVVDIVAEERGVPAEQIYGSSRLKRIVHARQEAAYLAFNAMDTSLRVIALGIGRSDHTTVLNSIKNVERRAAEDPEYKSYLDSVSLTLASLASQV